MIPQLRLETGAGLSEIILNRPERQNALSAAMWEALPALIMQANAAADSRVIVLHGGQSGAFAAGADISEFGTLYTDPQAASAQAKRIAAALRAVEDSEKPVIAAIEGACIGGGVSLAMAADLRIAGKGALFGVTPARLGLVYPPDDTRRLIDSIGPGRAKDLLFSARILPAEEASSIGLVDRLVAQGSALGEARLLATQMAAVSQWSLRAIKRMIRLVTRGEAGAAETADALFVEGFSGEDFREGYQAFLEKRPPHFASSR